MTRIERTTQFKRDYKRELKGRHRKDLSTLLLEVLEVLANNQQLEIKYKDHALTGEWSDYRDCHIKPDLILIYRNPAVDVLQLVRLGSHSQLGI